jgi:ribosomal protein S28E/S33
VIYFVLYSSKVMSPRANIEDLEILRVSWARNNDAGVTGYLLRAGDTYYQWLEGPEQAVIALMARIKTDIRHNDITMLMEGTAEARKFTHWLMGYSDIPVGQMGPEISPEQIVALMLSKAKARKSSQSRDRANR